MYHRCLLRGLRWRHLAALVIVHIVLQILMYRGVTVLQRNILQKKKDVLVCCGVIDFTK
jgi:hypothetical protein